MALSIADIMQVAAPSAIRAARRPYTLGGITEMAEAGWRTALYDNVTGAGVTIAWTHVDAVRNRSEREKIDFVTALLENAIHTLDFFIEQQQQPVDVIDVDFS
jgi:hypothetical protein